MAVKTEHDLVSVLRRPDGLYAYLVQRAVEFYVSLPTANEEQQPLALVDPFVERLVPLREIAQAKTGPLKSALASWDGLAHVERLDGAALFHVVNVLLHSLPDETANGTSAPLTFEPAPAVFRPTAANPRAYKGTKDRPPKQKKHRSMDLRPHLSSARDVNELILKLAPFHQEARRLLKKADILARDLPPLVDAKGRVQDVYLVCFHGKGQESLLSLPFLFRRGFLFWRRGEPWSQVGRMLALYRALGLDTHAPLRRCVDRLVAIVPFAHALDWCDLILEQPDERRTAFAELLVESDLRWKHCPQGIGEAVRRANDLTPDRYYRHRMLALIACARDGGDLDYLLSGMELAEEYDERYSFDSVGKGGKVPMESIRTLVEHTSGSPLAWSVWSACAELDGLDRVIRNVPWLELTPASAQELLYLFVNTVHDSHLDADLRAAKWAVLRDRAGTIFECVKGVPARYQDKALRHFKQITGLWDLPEKLDWALREYEKLLPRLCRPPFVEAAFEAEPLSMLTRLEDADWERIREAPDEVFRMLEAACRRKNEAELISGGLHFLSKRVGGGVTEGMLSETSALLKAARLIGGLGRSIQRETLMQWMAHPIMDDGLDGLSTGELVSIMGNLPKEVHAQIPRKLRDHVRGNASLRPKQVERVRTILLEAIPGVRWRLLGHLGLERLASPLNPGNREAKALHAVRFYGNIDENRRALRRFLQAYFKGDKDYLRRHPVNQGWLLRQKQLNRKVWLEEMATEGKRADGSLVRLHIELDPLEALRLGTYMGTCTGLGGRLAASAAAVVLDLNKHVIYARNVQGAVVARQLVAVSDDEQMVCFNVYPAGASDDLKKLFSHFDVALARRLGLDIYKPGEESGASGNVELLLSRDWWDDGAWDPGVDGEKPGAALEGR